MRSETAQWKWQSILAEYALARAEYQIAAQVFSDRRQIGRPVDGGNSPEFVAEHKARQRLYSVRDRMSELEQASWLDTPGVLSD